LQRDGGPRLELVPDPGAPDAFTLAILPAARIRFVRDDADRVVALEVLQPGASEWETSWRDGSASAP
ncbi:MAG TPA: hypothetical protein VKU85_01120, partial [bacterium]|nr:hypothetical protein [bacterium]